MSDIKISIDDLPPAVSINSADVFVIDQLGGDGYTKKLTYLLLKQQLGNDAFVYRSGDTMTGPLILSTSSPVSSLQAASKGYVDGKFLSRAGGTMTGAITLHTNSPTNALHAASKGYVQSNYLPISGIGTGAQGTGMTGYLTLCAHPVSAFHAATKAYVDSNLGDGAPIGSVMFFSSSAAPVSWFECDGSIISKTIYTDLFNVIGYTYGGSGDLFHLPDLRGEFVRGWDNGRGIDSGRQFGSAQSDLIKNHTHPIPVDTPLANGGSNTGTTQRGTPSSAPGVDATSNNTDGGTETRPRNIALLPCIKYAAVATVNNLGLSAQSILSYINSLSSNYAKAWVTFNGETATPAISASYNISTGTKNSTGNYTFTFATALADNKYGVFINDNYEGLSAINRYVVSQTTTQFTVQFKDSGAGGNVYNPPFAYITIFGN